MGFGGIITSSILGRQRSNVRLWYLRSSASLRILSCVDTIAGKTTMPQIGMKIHIHAYGYVHAARRAEYFDAPNVSHKL